MARSDDLRRERNTFSRALQNVRATANSLSQSINSLQNASNIQNNSYRVNDLSGGSNYLTHLIDREKSIYSNIIQNVIPGIENRISSLNYRIQEAIIQEENERNGV